jgi:NADPH-dependent 2,4-dienoyl-CoA reductase/sulfur reductase-like enzyme
VTSIDADVAVVGLGPAGIAAAVCAAEAGGRVVALDDGVNAGGQIWRHRARRTLPPVARAWLERLERQVGREASDGGGSGSARIVAGAACVDAAGPGRLIAVRRAQVGETEDTVLEIRTRRLIVATGARERFLPFPGWTLPGVIGVGGAQALVKSGGSVRGLRVMVAGSGPLLLPVAATLARAGAHVSWVAEQATAARVARFAASLWRHPRKIAEALLYRAAFAGARQRTGTWVTQAMARAGALSVTLTDGKSTFEATCDLLACGFGLVPNLELPRLLGCAVNGGAVVVDDSQRASEPAVFAAGEACGVGGAELALVEGEIAGRAAVGAAVPARLLRQRGRLRAFARRLETAFAPRAELRALADPETVVCRCEDVPRGRLHPAWTPRQAKLYTRAGMGPCQGRVCGGALELLFGWPPDTVRPPLYPIPFAAMKENET